MSRRARCPRSCPDTIRRGAPSVLGMTVSSDDCGSCKTEGIGGGSVSTSRKGLLEQARALPPQRTRHNVKRKPPLLGAPSASPNHRNTRTPNDPVTYTCIPCVLHRNLWHTHLREQTDCYETLDLLHDSPAPHQPCHVVSFWRLYEIERIAWYITYVVSVLKK